MANEQQGDHLSWGDTVFLHLEREGMPLNVASVSIFDGEIPFADCIQHIEARLPKLPRYLQRVVPPPLNLGLPTWEYDPEFNIRNHVREASLKRGTEAELKTLAGKLFSKVMDRQHPLWDLTFVHGLKGKRTGLILRMHHCVADGIAGVGMVQTLLDTSPDVPRPHHKKVPFRVPPRRNPIDSFVDGMAGTYGEFSKKILSAWSDLLSIAERAASNNQPVPAGDLSQLMPEIGAFTERLRFNVLYRGPQKFAWADIPLAEIKTIGHTCATSVNDVILTLVTGTIRRYLGLHGDDVKGRLLRMMVPVNLRANNGAGAVGNSISLVPVTIPLDIRDPLKLLAGVHRRTEFLKGTHAAEVVSLAAGLISVVPTPVQALAGSVISRLPFTPFNLVCTNVPGPQYPLYLMGHKMLRWYPYVPVGGEMAVNCAILSYDGAVNFGFSGEVHAVPDLWRMEAFLKESFRELRDAARGKKTDKAKQSKRTRSKKTGEVTVATTTQEKPVEAEKSLTELIA